MPSQERIERIVREYRQGLSELLGDGLEAVVLYGSRARKDAGEGSDIDLLCVMREPFDYGDLLMKTSELTAALSLAHDVVISRAFATREDYESKRTPFMMNVRAEGVPV